MIDMSDAIRELGVSYTVTRRSVTVTNGYRTVGTATTFTVTAVEDPLDGDELSRLAAGARVDGMRALISDGEIRAETTGAEADEVTIDGEQYSVVKAQPWRMGNFWRVVVARKR